MVVKVVMVVMVGGGWQCGLISSILSYHYQDLQHQHHAPTCIRLTGSREKPMKLLGTERTSSVVLASMKISIGTALPVHASCHAAVHRSSSFGRCMVGYLM